MRKVIFEILFFIPAYVLYGLGYLAHQCFLELRAGWQTSWLEFQALRDKLINGDGE